MPNPTSRQALLLHEMLHGVLIGPGPEHSVEGLNGVRFRPFEDVPVDVQGSGGLRVPEDLLDCSYSRVRWTLE